MRRPGHPSLNKLQRWVAGEDLPLEKHLSTCDYCADRLEPIIEEGDLSIKAALLQLLDAPEQLPERLRSGISTRLKNQQELLLIGELFGLPMEMARVMAVSDQGDQ